MDPDNANCHEQTHIPVRAPIQVQAQIQAQLKSVHELSPREMELAYQHWCLESDRAMEVELKQFYKAIVAKESWIRIARSALHLNCKTVGQRMGISESAFSAMERREELGEISLKKLRSCAAALDCDLVYAVVPKKKVGFSRLLWAEIYPVAMQHRRVVQGDPRKKWRRLAAVARQMRNAPGFQRRRESQPLR